MLYYAILSGVITACLDFVFLFICAKVMLLTKKAGMYAAAAAERTAESAIGMAAMPGPESGHIPIESWGRGPKFFGQSFHWGTIFLLLFVSVIIFVLIFHLMTRKITKYIEDITRSIQNIAQGDFSTKLEVKYDNEFSIIAQNLNIMALDLRLLKEKEQEAEKRAQQVYGEKYSPPLMFGSKKAVSRMLHEGIERQSVRRMVRQAQQTFQKEKSEQER